MPHRSAQVTAAEIARLAGVTRATVSNWRRRHVDFPAPVGGTEASPTYDLDAVRAWLAARGQLPAHSAPDDLRAALRTPPANAATPSRLLPLVLAAAHLDKAELTKLIELPDERLARRTREMLRPYRSQIPGVTRVTYQAEEAALVRLLLHCVRDQDALRAVDVLAQRESDDSGAAGAYATPEPLAELMADLLAQPGEPFPTRVFDPACGAGHLLVAAARRGARELYGQDLLPARVAQAALRLGLAAPNATSSLRAGDSMRADAFPSLAAEAVLCAPPYGDRDWGHEELAYDSRWVYGLPPRGEPELAWVQHCLAHLTPGGWAVLLMPPATAERLAGRRIRAELLRSGTLRAVVALPAGAAAPLHVGLHLWLLQRPAQQAGIPRNILFVNSASAVDTADVREGANATSPAKRPGPDWPRLREVVLGAWASFAADPDGFATVSGTAQTVPVIDLLDETVDLTPARHVRAIPIATEPEDAAAAARALRNRLRSAVAVLEAASEGKDWPPAGAQPRVWRTATVADLLRGGALTLLRADTASREDVTAFASTTGHENATRRTRASSRTGTTQRARSNSRGGGGQPEDIKIQQGVKIQPGDVILPELLRSSAHPARVADAAEAGAPLGRYLYLLRPDPQRLDPWFLAGFLAAEENRQAAATGSLVVRVDVRRLRVPLLPLAEQRRYGRAFRRLAALRSAAEVAGRLVDEAAYTLAAGLTTGVLLPPDDDAGAS